MIQPILQTSAYSPYEHDPRRTYGALYQRVATPSVITLFYLSVDFNNLAKPKSQIFEEQLESSKIFDGLRSL